MLNPRLVNISESWTDVSNSDSYVLGGVYLLGVSDEIELFKSLLIFQVHFLPCGQIFLWFPLKDSGTRTFFCMTSAQYIHKKSENRSDWSVHWRTFIRPIMEQHQIWGKGGTQNPTQQCRKKARQASRVVQAARDLATSFWLCALF